MLKKIEFSYNDANYNAEFLIEILTSIGSITKTKKITLGVINAVPNDQEQFSEKKGLFSEEVITFNNKIRDSHGMQVEIDKIVSILKQCRTVWELSVSIALYNEIIIPSLEDSEESINKELVVFELNLIEGDLFTLFYNNDFNIAVLLDILKKYKAIIE